VVSERESVLGFGHNSICRNVERRGFGSFDVLRFGNSFPPILIKIRVWILERIIVRNRYLPCDLSRVIYF
jgi:hypothetical protein